MKHVAAGVAVILVLAGSLRAQSISDADRPSIDNLNEQMQLPQWMQQNYDAERGWSVGPLDNRSLTRDYTARSQSWDPKIVHHVDPSIDPKIVYHVDPSIDPRIVVQVPSGLDAEAFPTYGIPSNPMPKLTLPEFDLNDFKGALPLTNGTLDLKPGDTLRINGPNLKMEIPLPRMRVPKP